ncbi:methyltransferase [Gilvimarinus polysaccharolyticus]|uniref:methyltransferase n=1 Tax=Gilvimarinus polysaccharolyticus TaxID=863921 RepID=UPI00067364A5|nr:methyltransferase [Gilvimarinus polysaccharolyticus]
MNDPALNWLLNDYQNSPERNNTVWLCDEAAREFSEQLPVREQTQFISNRWDVYTRLNAKQHRVCFNDFDFSAIADNSQAQVYYRISKEKPVVHHIINAAARVLQPGGELIIAGLKNEGAKNFLDKAANVLGCSKATKKNGLAYSARLMKHDISALLDDSHYSHLRAIAQLTTTRGNEFSLWSKPGQFGWQKIDAGSEFLLATLQQSLSPTDAKLAVLDLGCGYGYLSCGAAQNLFNPQTTQFTLTDNNAAALQSAQHNCQQLELNANVVAADAGAEISERFDIVLCNPPFHQGFNVSDDLTERFIASASAHLKPAGHAYFVVNAFIGVEQKSKAHFKTCRELANNRQFKVLQLSAPY